MSLAAKRAGFCRRMQALSRVRHVQAARQGSFQGGQAEQERPVINVQGMREPAVQAVQEEQTGQPVEDTQVPA